MKKNWCLHRNFGPIPCQSQRFKKKKKKLQLRLVQRKKKTWDLVLLIFGNALDLDLFCITEQRAKMTSEMHEGTILV